MTEEKEYSFFRKLIISIKDFEKYPDLAAKSFGVVLSYLIKLLTIFVVIVSISSSYILIKQIKDGLAYVKNELPDFTFENNKLIFEKEDEIVQANNNNLVELLIFNTSNLEKEKLEEYSKKLNKVNNGLVFLQDKVLIKTQVNSSIIEYDYEKIVKDYQIQNFNKEELLDYFSNTNLVLIYLGIFIITSIYLFVFYFISTSLDVLLLGALGFFTAYIMRLRLRFVAMCKITIHSLTLPILLNAVAILIETFTSFKIQYFEILYIGVSYIYIITAILMIKSDILKNQKELAKIIEEQEKVRQELEKKKELEEEQKREDKKNKEKEEQRKKEKKEEKSKKDKKDNVGKEPQGENA